MTTATSAELPRLLLVTEATFNETEGGINRTLINLFSAWPPERLLLYAPANRLTTAPPAAGFAGQVVSFKAQRLPRLHSRAGLVLNAPLTALDCLLLEQLPLSSRAQLEQFNPEAVLVCSNGVAPFLAAEKLCRRFKCPLLVYAMDDWINEERWNWLTGSGRRLFRSALRRASAWLMISQTLADEFARRYSLEPPPTLIVHNPAALQGSRPEPPVDSEPFQLIYAGSIWPMHLDALLLTARAAALLRGRGRSIELCLHSEESFWKTHAARFTELGVAYGGHVPYEQLTAALCRGHLLVAASSFQPGLAALARASVQTKLTDYMAANRPLLSCGPAYSACSEFVRRWDCGWCVESTDAAAAADIISSCMDDRPERLRRAELGYEAVQREFDAEVVIERLYSFISNNVYPGS